MTQAFNLSQLANKVNTLGQLDVATGVTGTQAIANGGTGAASLTGNSVTITNAGGTALTTVAAGTSGNVLTSDGTTWISQAATGGQLQTELFTAPGTWTKPASCTQVKVTVVGGGGAGGGSSVYNGGVGGFGIAMVPVSAPVSITVGAGGAGSPSTTGASGGTSSFGPAVSATGGTGSTPGAFGTPGVGTVSVGTALRVNVVNTINYSGSNVYNSSGLFFGGARPGGPGRNAATTYSSSSPENAGGTGIGAPSAANRAGATSGAILVEYVG
jgi:hypothetical protein